MTTPNSLLTHFNPHISPHITHTISSLSAQLTTLSFHQHTLLHALRTHFTCPILTFRSVQRFLLACSHLTHTLRTVRDNLSRSTVVASAILHEVAQLGCVLGDIALDGNVLVANMERVAAATAAAGESGAGGENVAAESTRGGKKGKGRDEQREEEGGEEVLGGRDHLCWKVICGFRGRATEGFVERMEECQRKRRVRKGTSKRIGMLADRIVRLRRRAEKAVRR